jgi:hypothetical protein
MEAMRKKAKIIGGRGKEVENTTAANTLADNERAILLIN